MHSEHCDVCDSVTLKTPSPSCYCILGDGRDFHPSYGKTASSTSIQMCTLRSCPRWPLGGALHVQTSAVLFVTLASIAE